MSSGFNKMTECLSKIMILTSHIYLSIINQNEINRILSRYDTVMTSFNQLVIINDCYEILWIIVVLSYHVNCPSARLQWSYSELHSSNKGFMLYVNIDAESSNACFTWPQGCLALTTLTCFF